MQILKVIGLLMEYPDELLWECKEDALALIRRDAPMLTDFTRNLLNAPLLDKQAEWCEVFDRGRTTSLLLFEHVHAESRDRGGQWWTCWRSMKRSACSWIVENCPIIYRCIWST